MKKVETEHYYQLVAEDGMYITNYNPTDDIDKFSSFKSCYCPLTTKIDEFYEISEEQNTIYMEKLEKYNKEQEEKNK